MNSSDDEIFWVISNYNYDPEQVIDAIKTPNYCVYDQSDESYIEVFNEKRIKYKRTSHTGHNISDYLQYIIENYNDLPERVGFIKGNIFPRHIGKKIFEARIVQKGFIPLYSDVKTYKPKYHRFLKWKLVSQRVAPGLYMELANNWYVKTRKKGKRYKLFSDFFEHFFGISPPKYITFVPGACMIVTRDKILDHNLRMYRELYETVTYDFFPVEAFHAERSMLYLFKYLSE